MITKSLQIRFTDSSIHEPIAWFLPGESAALWLSEICTWDVPHSAVKLLIVPTSSQNPLPVGVLVVLPGDRAVSPGSRAHAYGQLAGQLYLPVEARLEPAVDEAELRKLLTERRQYVWHPLAGLVGFDPHEILRISDLLEPMPVTDAQWTAADPGIAFARRLGVIEALRPSVENILQAGQDDIGTEAESLSELPPAPDEKQPPGVLGKAAAVSLWPVAALIGWLGSQASKIANKVPKNTKQKPAKKPAQKAAPGGTWMDRLRSWANRVLSPEHQSARARELARLLNMLKNDPDKGLKYAIPMGNDAGRGIAPPSTVLSTHDVDFRFHSSGGPADYWHIPPVTLQQLSASYRELAEREIRLGRHRRAAYIYAELLGQMESAAAALKSGGYFREAATLFEERLHRPRDAAACLEEGGLWDEALERYEHLGDFEKCGQIHRRLGQHEEAEAAFQKAAMACVERGDLLRGAKLYDEECHDADAAVIVLRCGWPNANQAQECLRGEFRLLGREGRHAEAEQRVQELITPALASQFVPALAEVLSEAAGGYPDDGVRTKAADGTRVIVSRRLIVSHSKGGHTDDARLLRTVEKLAPDDRLLHRDCERYQRETEVNRAKVIPAPRRTGKPPECIASTQLPPDVIWQRAAASNRYYFAIGHRAGELTLARGSWNLALDPPQLVSWKSPIVHPAPVFLAPSPNDTHDVWVQLWSGPPLPQRIFLGKETQRAVTPPWTTRDTIALAQTANGVTWTVSGRDTLILGVYSSDHVPTITRQLSIQVEQDVLHWDLPMHARSEGLFLGLNDRLVSIEANHNDRDIPLAGRITYLSGSAPNSRVRIAASFEEGGVVFWKDIQRTRQFGHGLVLPRTAFTVTGKLIAVDELTMEVYGTGRNSLSLESSISSPGKPIAVMPVGRDCIAILCADGQLFIYRIAE